MTPTKEQTLRSKIAKVMSKNIMKDTAYTMASEGLKDDLLSLFEEEFLSIVGEDDKEISNFDEYNQGRNELRSQLRQEVKRRMGR